jgi:adenylosuccinate lyase
MFSALDSRYASRLTLLQPIVGEVNFIYFMSLWSLTYAECANPGVYLPLYEDREKLARRVAAKEVATQHQMMALLQVLQEDYPDITFHYGLTSEDIMHNSRWTQIALLIHQLQEVLKEVDAAVREFEKEVPLPILAHTHGQPATPVRLGPYLRAKLRRLNPVYPEYRFGGANGQLTALGFATGLTNFEAVAAAWARGMAGHLGELPKLQIVTPTPKLGLLQHGPSNEATIMSAISAALKLRSFARALWDHSYRGILTFETSPGQAGSSAMPHKVNNPIDFEQAEGAFSNAYHILLNGLEANADSRGLRDLSNSIVNRQLPEAWVYLYLGAKSLVKGMSKSSYNLSKIKEEIKNHPECLTELLRYYIQAEEHGADPYWELKKHPPNDFEAVIKRMKNWKIF